MEKNPNCVIYTIPIPIGNTAKNFFEGFQNIYVGKYEEWRLSLWLRFCVPKL